MTVTIRDTIGFTGDGHPLLCTSTTQEPTSRRWRSLSVTPASGYRSAGRARRRVGVHSDTDATPIAAYTFNFGDGTTGTARSRRATADHTYAGAGTFTVTVTVTDTGGLASQANASVVASANLVTNSGFETGLNGWNTSGSGSGISLVRVSGGHSGSWSAQLSNTGTPSSSCLLNDSPNWVSATVKGTYTGALWVRADAAGAALKLRWREYSGSTLMGSSTASVALTTSWQKLSLDVHAGCARRLEPDLNAFVSNAVPGTCFYADDVTITRS